MNLINEILNIGAPPFIFFSLCFFLPLFQFLKFSVSILSSIYAEDVAGKVVIITGTSSGIGEAYTAIISYGLFKEGSIQSWYHHEQLAYEYARRGACLVLAARREQSLRDVAYMCLELGSPDSITVTADVSIVDDCKRIVDSTISHFGRVDHLVNNAGITSISMIEDYEDIIIPTSIMDINFWGAVYVTHFAIPHLRKTEGKIIVMSSSAAWLPTPRMSIYNASKAAMIAFYETLRVELGSDIQITIATPGFVESEMTKGKHLAPEGLMNVDVNLRDVQVSALPIVTGQRCAKAIINSACRGDRYVTEPTWYKVFSWWKAFTPELLDWFFSAFYLIKIGDSSFNSLSKMILDLPGLRAMVYPSSVYSPGVKTK